MIAVTVTLGESDEKVVQRLQEAYKTDQPGIMRMALATLDLANQHATPIVEGRWRGRAIAEVDDCLPVEISRQFGLRIA